MARQISWTVRGDGRAAATYIAEMHCDPPVLAEPIRPRPATPPARPAEILVGGRRYVQRQVRHG